MSNMLRTMMRGSMAPHFWNGRVWKRRAPEKQEKKTGTILDFLRAPSRPAPMKPGGFLHRMAAKIATAFKSQRGR